MASVPVFISFDYDHDLDCKNLLVGQAKNPDSPFEIADWSVKKASPDWKADPRSGSGASSRSSLSVASTQTARPASMSRSRSLGGEEAVLPAQRPSQQFLQEADRRSQH